MSGFRDLLALMLGWKTSSPKWPGWRVAAGQVHAGGADQRGGRPAGQLHTSGTTAGQVYG